MIKVEQIVNSRKSMVKAHCGDCYRVLDTDEEGIEPLDIEEAVNFMLSVCERHVKRHPCHNPNVYVYQKIPRNKELRGD